MHRDARQGLISWGSGSHPKPLLLRGARQVGKTHLVREFARTHFQDFCEVNFELTPQYQHCFESLDPVEIIKQIQAFSGKTITPGITLLFLDEIQICPNAIMALRYFYERMPNLRVIAAGSLLEFAFRESDFRMPVGRVDFLYLKPLSFSEYLQATNNSGLLEYFSDLSINKGIPEALHQKSVQLLREYLFLGGMPEVVNAYLSDQQVEHVHRHQTALLTSYRNDFGKYASSSRHKYLQKLFEKAPSLVGEQFRYSKIDGEFKARELKPALFDLIDAGLLYLISHTNATGIPLDALLNEKKFKLLFLDVGLMRASNNISPHLLLQEDLMLVNQGRVIEQFVGQELLVYQPWYLSGKLFYWEREKQNSQAEVDYVINYEEMIVPIEAKAGRTGRLRSLQVFMQERQLSLGVRLSLHPLEWRNNILSVPLYLINHLPQLIKQVLRKNN